MTNPFDPEELVLWAERYGHPEEWAKRAQSAHTKAEHGLALAVALDRFFDDLRYTLPEAAGHRVNELAARIGEPMAAFGYPRKKAPV